MTVPAKLRQLSDAADRQTRTYEARYVLEGALAEAPLGATVTIRLPEGNAAAAPSDLQVPIARCTMPARALACGCSTRSSIVSAGAR